MSWTLREVVPPTHISEGTRLEGDLHFISTTQIFGIIDGNIEQESLESLQIGQTGWVHGSVRSQGPVIVEGRIDGNISSATEICLKPTASVRGAISAPRVLVRPGAVFDGEMEMQAHHADKKRKKAA